MSFAKCNEMIDSEKCGLDVVTGPCPNHKKIRALEKERNSLMKV